MAARSTNKIKKQTNIEIRNSSEKDWNWKTGISKSVCSIMYEMMDFPEDVASQFKARISA